MNKQLTLIFFIFCCTSLLMASSGVFQTFSFHTVNGGSLITTHGGIDNSSGTSAWSGNNLGSDFTTLVLNGGEVQTFKNGGSNVTGAALFYRVYKQGSSAPTYTSINLPFLTNFGNPGDQKWNTGAANVDLLSGLTENGTYNVELYWEAYSSDGTHSDGNSASPFTATFSMTTFAIELINFSVKKIHNNNQLSWQTASEVNNSHFDLQRSKDAKTWTNIGRIQGKGSSNQTQFYHFEDAKPHASYNHYRLKQIDFDGAYHYSPIITVNNERFEVHIFPNPSNDYFELKIVNYNKSDKYTTLLISTQGAIIKQLTLKTSNTRFPLNDIPTGVYLINIYDKKGLLLLSEKLIKER